VAPIDAVYFPLDGVISLVTALQDGDIVEVATIGNGRIVGVPNVTGGSLAVRGICQVVGRSLWMDSAEFLNEIDRVGPFRTLMQNRTILAAPPRHLRPPAAPCRCVR
jgi:hypothetical protein